MLPHYLRASWSKILETELIIISEKPNKEKMSRIGGAFKELFYHRSTVTVGGTGKDILFLKSMPRKDYDDLFKTIHNACQREHVDIDVRLDEEERLSFYPLFIAMRYIAVISRIRASSFFDWIFLYLRSIRVLESFHNIRNFDYEALVVFADMQMLDSLCAQVANIRAKKTVTLQHGLYIDYSNHHNVNVTNYKNVVSNYFLAWGKNTAGLIKKYHPATEVVICGKPIVEQKLASDHAEYFTMICDQNVFFDYNRQLLKLCYNYARINGLKVNLRMHPNNRIQWFAIEPSLTLEDRELWSSRFVVGHTSSLLYECMRLGLPAFKFESDIPCVETEESLCFSSAVELENCYMGSLDSGATEEKGKKYIAHIGDSSLKQYTDFFDTL